MKVMDFIMFYIAIFFVPVLCILFVLNGVEIAKKIKQGNLNTGKNTFWLTFSFTLIIYSIVWLLLRSM